MEGTLVKATRFPKVFFGWWMVLTGGIIGMWVAGFGTYGFSALFKPISLELGFSRAAASIPASISRLEGGLEGPIIGWLTDRFGSKWLVLAGVSIVSLSLLLMYYINSLWAFVLVWGVLLGTGHNIALGVPVDRAIANWFVKKRGAALGAKWTINGFSGMIILPLIAWLIPLVGWRMTSLVGGLAMALVCLPLAWFFFKPHRPEYYGLLPDGASSKEEATKTDGMIEKGIKYASEVEEVEFTLRQALRTSSYWLLILTFAGFALAGPALNIHLIPFLTDIGIDPVKAASLVAMWITISLPFRFIGGILADRVHKNQLRLLVMAGYLSKALGLGIFLLNQTEPMIYVWFVVYGIGQGLAYGPSTPIWVSYFGRKAVGSIRGSSMFFMTPVGIAAPIYAGWVYDTTGSYITAFTAAGILLIAAVVLISLALPPKPPAQVTDVHQII